MAVWYRIDQTPIPLSIGRIWLADEDGNVRRAMSWTWPVLKRREPRRYRQWMIRPQGAKVPPPPAAAHENPGETSLWSELDKTPIPVSAGRIWLADRDGNIIRAMSWTWPILRRRQPNKYRRWMLRAQGATEPPV
jgi:hypothetical protein